MVRAASFVPSATEWAYALGLEDRLVAVTSGCRVPQRALREKPAAVRSALDGKDLSASEVDRFVRDAVRAGLPLYDLDADVLRGARPDTLLVQSLCDVCSPSEPNVEEATRILGARPRVVPLGATRLQEALEEGRVVAEALGAPGQAVALLVRLQAELDEVARAVADRPRPRVALLEWTDPPMRCGHWFPDVVHAAGGIEVVGEPGAKSVPTTWEAVAAAEPDILLVAPCGCALDRAVEEARSVAGRFPGTPVVALDADRHLSRSGPGLVASVRLLAHVLHPDAWPRDEAPATWARVA